VPDPLLRRAAPPLDGRHARRRPRVRPHLGADRARDRHRRRIRARRQALSLRRPDMTTSFGSRRLVVGAHYGLRDWLAQRVSSLLMALFTVAVVVQVLMPGPLDYTRWSAIFASQWMKVLAFVTVVALVSRLGRHARHLDG